jgi:hypothetical protein
MYLWTKYAPNKSNKHFGIQISDVFSGGVGFNLNKMYLKTQECIFSSKMQTFRATVRLQLFGT